MSTRSRIGYVENGVYKSCYCHHDGYVDYNGWILFHCFKDFERVKEMVSQGGFSSLGAISDTEVAWYGVYNDGEDDGWEDKSLESLIDNFLHSDQEYLYIYDPEYKDDTLPENATEEQKNNKWVYYSLDYKGGVEGPFNLATDEDILKKFGFDYDS